MATRTNVTREEFCLAWDENGGDAHATAEQLGLGVAHVRNQANRFRKQGIPLLPIKSKRGRKKDPVAEAAEIARISQLLVDRAQEEAEAKEEETVAAE